MEISGLLQYGSKEGVRRFYHLRHKNISPDYVLRTGPGNPPFLKVIRGEPVGEQCHLWELRMAVLSRSKTLLLPPSHCVPNEHSWNGISDARVRRAIINCQNDIITALGSKAGVTVRAP